PAAPVAGIVVGEPTRRVTARAVEYAAIQPIVAKGKHEPVRAWQAVALRADPGGAGAAPLVGRERELELLLGVVGSPSRLVTLVGPPGLGKTRLLRELCRALAAREEPFVWRQGRCLPYGDGVTFWALGEIVKAQAGILASDSPEEA